MPTLPDDVVAALTAGLEPIDAALAARHPGDPGTRQPVHTCYLPADQMRPDVVLTWGEAARTLLGAHAGDPAALAAATGGDPEPAIAAAVHRHVLSTLTVEPVQDLRVDLEDGYGIRPDDAEDADAVAAAEALRAAAAADALPVSYGLRPKSLDPAVRVRGLRSLDLFLTTLVGDDGPPAGLVLTLPKVSAAEQVTVFADVLTELERRLGIARVPFEIQIETPAAVLALPRLVDAGQRTGRLVGLHVGTYDYSAALGVAAAHQASDHPAVEYATTMMQLAAAGTGVRVADGSSNLLPVGAEAGPVHAAWRRHADLVRRAWYRGLYQGWDLHPGQLVSRHAAVAGCLLAGLDQTLARLGGYAAARRSGAIADEPATARALAGHVLRALDSGLLDEKGLTAAGLTPATVAHLGGRTAPPAR